MGQAGQDKDKLQLPKTPRYRQQISVGLQSGGAQVLVTQPDQEFLSCFWYQNEELGSDKCQEIEQGSLDLLVIYKNGGNAGAE